MKRLASVALMLALAALVATGCGGGGTTTVIEKTVTVEGEEETGGNTGGRREMEAQAKEEERELIAAEEAEEAEGSAEIEAEEQERGEIGPAEEKVEAPTRVVHVQTFRSPSGNIGCAMFEGGARCDIRKRDWSPPARPASCSEEVDFGQGLAVDHDGKASFVCAGDTTLDPGAKVLGYGEASELGGTICMSRSAGITCDNHSGHGFFISIQRYKIF